jgi:hypothetical protein
MQDERPEVGWMTQEDHDCSSRKEALRVLMEARDKLVGQMTREIVRQRDLILDGSDQDGALGFELQEIEDRYAPRLQALNSLLDNLEYRQSRLEYRVETLKTTERTVQKDLSEFLIRFDGWDLIQTTVLREEGDAVVLLVILGAEDYSD